MLKMRENSVSPRPCQRNGNRAWLGEMTVKRGILILLILAALLSAAACGKEDVREVSCEDIIGAYEDAGYVVTHGAHQNAEESDSLCYVKASLSEEPDSDYIYFIVCFTEEQAEKARQTDQYHFFKWLYASVLGEARWLKVGTHGKIEYSYYNAELIRPFRELVES